MEAEKLLASFNTLTDAPDGVGQLRELIMQLAVRGKLVPQDQNEESADILLRTLSELADQRGGLLAPILGTNDELAPVFAIPDSWRWVRLVHVGDIVGGGTPKTCNNSGNTKELTQ